MGVHSTLEITRTKAQELTITRLEEMVECAKAGRCSDTGMERFLDLFLEPNLKRAHIVGDGDKNKDDEAEYLMSLSESSPFQDL